MTTEENSGTSTTELDVSTTETQATPPVPGTDDQKPTPDATDDNAGETTEQKEAKEKSKFQRRLDRHKAEKVAAQTEARLLRERLDKLEAQGKPQQDGEPQRADFKDYESYLRAVTKYDAEQVTTAKLKSEREATQGRERQAQGADKIAKAWDERESAFKAANKDYAKVIEPFLEDGIETLSNQARAALVESDAGPALLHYLALNPDEAERIADLSPTRQIAELGKLETKVSMPAKRTTSAPPPPSHTQGGKTATKDPSKMDQNEYEAWRKSQGARWAR